MRINDAYLVLLTALDDAINLLEEHTIDATADVKHKVDVLKDIAKYGNYINE